MVDQAQLTDRQLAIIERPAQGKLFLCGPASTGKTTAAVGWLRHLLASGVDERSILVLVPQRTLASPYYDELRRPTLRAGGQVTISTMGGLAQRMVELFWPLIAAEAGFARADAPPTFLTLETSQYYMARLVRPLLDQGYFDSLVIDRNRLYSQILDNLNKAAVVGFPHTEIGERLKGAWAGQESQKRIYDEAQACASLFRDHCLAHNLLDFSLQLQVFWEHLWPLDLCRKYLVERYTHLVVDNVEEDTPVSHDLLRDWLPHCDSALVIYDEVGGYRRFLGADPDTALELRALCDESVCFTEPLVSGQAAVVLAEQLQRSLLGDKIPVSGSISDALEFKQHRYYPQMLDWVADQIASLVHDRSVPAGEIVVLSPFMPDGLRFSLAHRLERRSVATRSHRPSRSLRDEAATHCLLTLAAIAHPQWSICPSKFEVAYALTQAIEGMDLVRARVLTEIVYRVRDDLPSLSSFDDIAPEMKDRLTYLLGERYESLRAWLSGYAAEQPAELDHFLSRLFGEVLSQVGFGFHRDYDASAVASNLVESVQKFRWVTGGSDFDGGKTMGQEYVEMVRDGVVAAQYMRGWRLQPEDAVLLAPAYTFLMANRPVDVQFWLDVGSSGWWERLYQPLTHPYVLSRHWPSDAVWDDSDELSTRRDALSRVAAGLVRRCRSRIYLASSELGEGGNEQKGELLRAIGRLLRRLPFTPEDRSV